MGGGGGQGRGGEEEGNPILPTFRIMWTGQLHEGVSVHLGVREQAPPTFRRIMRARRLCEGVAAGGQLSREWRRCRRWRHGFAVLQHLGLLAALQLLTHLLHTTNPHGGSYVVWCSLPPHCCTWLTHLAPACLSLPALLPYHKTPDHPVAAS